MSDLGLVTTTTPDASALFNLDYLVLKKKEFSLKQHYDFEDMNGRKLAEAEAGIVAKMPARFGVYEWTSTGERGQELFRIESKIVSVHHEFTIYGSAGEALACVKRTVQVNPFGSSLHSYWVEDPRSGEKILKADGPPMGQFKLMTQDGKPAVEVQRRFIGTIFGVPEDYRYPTELGVAFLLPGVAVDRRVVIGSVLVIDFLGHLDGRTVGAYVSKRELVDPSKQGRIHSFMASQLERARVMQESLPPEKRVRAITCPHCNTWNPRTRDSKLGVFCINCTKPLPIPQNEMVSCSKCMKDMPANEKKCPNCGKKY